MRRLPGATWWAILAGLAVLATLAGGWLVGWWPTAPGGGAAASSPTAPATSSSPIPPAADAEPADFLWAFAGAQFDAGGMVQDYTLQAGTLADAAPALDLNVPFNMADRPNDLGRRPAFALADGIIVYIADDAAHSQVRLATARAPVTDGAVAEIPEAVWSVVVAPGGQDAYLLLAHRAPAAEAGVVRLRLDGSARIDEVLPPAGDSGASADIRLVATSSSIAQLIISEDGRHLVRRVCPGPAACALDAVDLTTGDVVALPDRTPYGIAGGMLVTQACAERVGCQFSAIDLGSGEEQPLPAAAGSTTAVVAVAGGPVLVHDVQPPGGEAGWLAATDIASGEIRPLLQAEAAGAVILHSNELVRDLLITPPPGWVVATVSGPQGSQELLAVRITDGHLLPLPPVPMRQPLFP